MEDDRFQLLAYGCERFHDVTELLDHLKESSQMMEESVAVLSVFRHDGSGFKSVLEESLHVVFGSKSVVSGPTDVRFEPRA